MDYDQLIGQVVNALELSSREDGLKAARSVLTTLGERLESGEASDLAAPLPEELGRFLLEANSGQQFSFDEFLNRVGDRGDVDTADAQYRAQAVISLIEDVIPRGEIDDVRTQLPEEYSDLFELLDQQFAEE